MAAEIQTKQHDAYVLQSPPAGSRKADSVRPRLIPTRRGVAHALHEPAV